MMGLSQMIYINMLAFHLTLHQITTDEAQKAVDIGIVLRAEGPG